MLRARPDASAGDFSVWMVFCLDFSDTCRNLHRLLSAQCQWSRPGRNDALWPAQNDQFSVSRHLLGKVMRVRRAPVKGPQKACCLSKCFGSQSPPWMPPVFGASGEPGGWMTVRDEGGWERGEWRAGQDRRLDLLQKKEGGRCVCVGKLNELTTAVGGEVRGQMCAFLWPLGGGVALIGSVWADFAAL